MALPVYRGIDCGFGHMTECNNENEHIATSNVHVTHKHKAE